MTGETVVLGWLTLELTDSPLLVGVAMGARMLPLFFVGVPGGVLADRFRRQRLLMVTGAGQALTAATIGVLTLLGLVGVAPLLILTLAAGAFNGVSLAARQSYAHDVVGAPALISGFAALGLAMRSGQLLGSLVAGATIARWGSAAAYLVVAAGYLAGVSALLPASTRRATTAAAHGSLWRSVIDFATTMGKDRVIPVLMMLTAGAEILGFSHQALLPSLARDVLRVGPEGLGVMNAARSVGGILGLFAVATLRPARGAGTLFLAVLVSFGAGLVALGAAPHLVGYAGVIVLLVLVNSMGGLADLLAQSLLQLSVSPQLRGRAGGAWVVAIGLAPLGQLQIGALASLFGVSIALGASGLALVVLASATVLACPWVRRL